MVKEISLDEYQVFILENVNHISKRNYVGFFLMRYHLSNTIHVYKPIDSLYGCVLRHVEGIFYGCKKPLNRCKKNKKTISELLQKLFLFLFLYLHVAMAIKIQKIMRKTQTLLAEYAALAACDPSGIFSGSILPKNSQPAIAEIGTKINVVINMPNSMKERTTSGSMKAILFYWKCLRKKCGKISNQ